MIDLHTHTTMSDGQYTPSEVVRLAKEKGITALAITDHDTASGVEEGMAEANKALIEFVPGIEISVKSGDELHILGYFIDVNNTALKRMCDEFTALRQERKTRILKFLNDRGVPITLEQVEAQAGHDRIGRPHFAKAMLEAKYVSSINEAFDLHLATPEFSLIERPKPSAQAGIEVIRQAGGVAVLAHPGQVNLSQPDFEALLNELMEYGLKGMECYYSTHTKEQTAYFLALANKNKLIVTGGSDFHGERVKRDIELGSGIQGSLCFDGEGIVGKLREAARA